VGGPGHYVHWTRFSVDISFNDCLYCTNLCTVQELQVEIETVAEEITGDTLYNTVDNFMVCLQQVHKVEGSYIEHAFT